MQEDRIMGYGCSTTAAPGSGGAEGYGLEEIETITGIGKDVLRARLHRARLSLARYLEQGSNEAVTPIRIGSKS